MSTPNPYAAPRAPVADAAAAVPRNFIPTGRALAGGRGWAWITEGWGLFKRQPFIWVAFTVVGIAILFALQMLPVIGQIAAMLLGPVFVGGIMIGCRDLEEGRELQFAHLFAGFRERFGSLLSVGLISLGFTFAVALVVGLGTGIGAAALLGSGGDPAAAVAAGLSLLLALLVMLALLLPLYMAMWFAAPLIVFHAQGPGAAMKASFVACLKNIVPFFVYSVIFFLLSFLASLPAFLGWLVLGPVMAASLYTGYRDIFFE